MSPRLPHQGRHPGDAHRRGDDRALNILLVRLRLIGDVVFTTPIVQGLRQAFPDAHLTYLVEAAAAPVVRGNRHLDRVLVVPRRTGIRRITDDLTLARQLRRAAFDVVIDLHGGPRSAWLARATGAPVRVGYTLPGRSWLYTHHVPRSPEPSVRHSVLNQWDLLAPLGIDGPPDGDRLPVQMPDVPAASHAIAERLAAWGVRASSPLLLIHVSASNPFKRWPADAFVETIVRLLGTRPERFAAVVSGPSEPDAAEAVVQAAQARLGGDAARVAALHVDLEELRALAARATVYIGGDSGPLHVAATTQTSIVEILGPTVGSRSFPWRSPQLFAELIEPGPLPCRPCSERRCAPGDFRCLTGIDAERVIAAAERALAAARRPA